MKVSQSRLTAYDVLRDVDERNAYANLALPSRISKSRLNTRDAGFVTELVSGTLRMQGKYDRIIEIVSDRAVEKIDPRTLRILRLGVHQLTEMRVPAHAALSESVELQKLVANPKGAGLVNGVLRSVTRTEDWNSVLASEAKTREDSLATLTSHPAWIVRALKNSLASEQAEEEIEALLEADNIAPKVNMALLGSEEVEQDVITSLSSQLHFTGPSPIGWELEGGSPNKVQPLLEGLSHARVQDQGSQLAALALTHATPILHGERWLDLCAGPGGKTAILAYEALRIGATLRANEIAPHRAELVRCAVAPVSNEVDICSHDGREPEAYGGQQYDRILIDAPCSGLGALRRRPEARWRKLPSDIPGLTQLQEELVLSAYQHLNSGGVIAYVTCSPHLAETRSVVSRVLARSTLKPLRTQDVLQELAVEALSLGTGDQAQLWPHRNQTDAMFIALLQKP